MRVWIGNLPYSADEQDVREWLHQGGFTATSISLITDNEGTSKGFAFAEVDDQINVIPEMNGQEMNGRRIVVSEARERPNNARRPR